METSDKEVAMDALITFILLVVLIRVFVFFWFRSTEEQAPSEDREDLQFQAEAAPLSSDWDPYALSFVRHRLDVLAAELDLLENDHSVFARAFRTHVAKSAYDALLADASRLAEVSRLANVSGSSSTTMTIEIETPGSLGPFREELDV
jgi:hypothetical protein